ncbi:mannitol-1-phosphate 5-dehydrogenase [Cetobacterium sp.]|uniref:mannitol-1-phosphate 5-dehydrogenase n=1 Tax=Cetobacterium sp. TaxID=2071632 RepID=UPI003F388D82
MKKAIQFGAGNIGRGFIGKILSQSNFEVCFADVAKDIIDELNQKHEYNVEIVGKNRRVVTVKNVYGVMSNGDEIIEKIKKADLITTAVGPNILKLIAKTLAKGIEEREKSGNEEYLNIIACENMINGTSFLKEEIEKYLSQEIIEGYMKKYIGFPNSAVDRIVPPMDQKNNILDVKVEEFREWIVQKAAFKGEIPKIEGMELTNNLMAFIERKLFTLNTGHAITAYLGMLNGHNTVKESIEDPEVRKVVIDAMKESGNVLIKRYNFERDIHEKYINKILTRFENPHLKDEVFRVGREPLRKLGFNDRLIKPLRGTLDYQLKNESLVKGIAAAMKYQNENDPQAIELNSLINELGVKETFRKVSGLDDEFDLEERVFTQYRSI